MDMILQKKLVCNNIGTEYYGFFAPKEEGNVKLVNFKLVNSYFDELDAMGINLIKDNENYIICEANLRTVLLYLNYNKTIETLKNSKNSLEEKIRSLKTRLDKYEKLRSEIPSFDKIVDNYSTEQEYYDISDLYFASVVPLKDTKRVENTIEYNQNDRHFEIFKRDDNNIYTSIFNDIIKFSLTMDNKKIILDECTVYPYSPISIKTYLYCDNFNSNKDIIDKEELLHLLSLFKTSKFSKITIDTYIDNREHVSSNDDIKELLKQYRQILIDNGLWDNKKNKPITKKRTK